VLTALVLNVLGVLALRARCWNHLQHRTLSTISTSTV